MAEFVDISNNQGADPDWAAYAVGHSLIALKASEGTSFKDGTFSRRWKAAGEAGLARWAYHFAKPGISGSAQADYLIDIVEAVGSLGGRDRICLDVEGSGWGAGEAAKLTKDFASRSKNRGYQKGVVYTGAYFRTSQKIAQPSGWLWWIASYGTAIAPTPCDAWQFTDKATVAGMPTQVDYSHLYVTLEDEDMTPDEIRAAVKPLIDDLGKVLLAAARADGTDDPTHYGLGDVKRDLNEMKKTLADIDARVKKLEKKKI